MSQPLTEPFYVDVMLPAARAFEEILPGHHNAFVYVVSGSVLSDDGDGGQVELMRDELGILAHGERVSVTAGVDGARLLLVAGRPLNEPVVRGGPFVMNTKAQIRQAEDDYAAGRL